MSVTVFANPQCPHCVRAVDHLADLALESGVTLAAVDLVRHPDATHRWHAETSPLVVFDDRYAYPGIPRADTFRALAKADSTLTDPAT